jgi:hypothetical protein
VGAWVGVGGCVGVRVCGCVCVCVCVCTHSGFHSTIFETLERIFDR